MDSLFGIFSLPLPSHSLSSPPPLPPSLPLHQLTAARDALATAHRARMRDLQAREAAVEAAATQQVCVAAAV